MKQREVIGKKVVAVLNSIVNLAVLFSMLLLILFGSYALWDSNQLFKAADSSLYSMYKPTTEENVSFKDLQKTNKDIFGWLTVYGTNIDYPLLQGETNEKYLSKNIHGEYTVSGSLFLDYRNSQNFTDFNSIIYGHHMEKDVMFGEIEHFSGRTYFDEHKFGNLFYDGKDHGIEFFAFLEVDAYDTSVYNVAVPERLSSQYLNNLLTLAKNTREIGVTASDKIVLLSTCTSDTTNGRHILVGRIKKETYSDTFKEHAVNGDVNKRTDNPDFLERLKQIPVWIWIILIILVLFVAFIVYKKVSKKMQGTNNKGTKRHEQ